jgi:peroxiredoxin Q/BCP
MAPKVEPHPLENKKAPAFTLDSISGAMVKLSQFKGSIVIVYFYPKDNTPGCTMEANDFRDVQPALAALDATVLGISPDSVDSHCKFAQKYHLNFQLLADTDHGTAEKYGVWVEKSLYGKKYMGIERTTFLIDREGKVRRVWRKVKPEGHARAVLEAVQAIAAS